MRKPHQFLTGYRSLQSAFCSKTRDLDGFYRVSELTTPSRRATCLDAGVLSTANGVTQCTQHMSGPPQDKRTYNFHGLTARWVSGFPYHAAAICWVQYSWASARNGCPESAPRHVVGTVRGLKNARHFCPALATCETSLPRKCDMRDISAPQVRSETSRPRNAQTQLTEKFLAGC